ncbi:MAG: EAL domain-containing protein [Succinivibrio sp.]|nr:EAL domain-containing protein [Succinivibrio sp.]
MLFKTVHYLKLFSIITALSINFCSLIAEAAELKTVRVGYMNLPNFTQVGSNDHIKSGFAYDYLQEIANLSGWKYDYVYGNNEELLTMLKDGSIDILAGVPYSDTLSKDVRFPDLPMTSESHNIYVHADNNATDFDLKDLEEKNVGVKSNSISLKFLQRWNENGNYRLNIIEYNNNKDRKKAFDAYELDALADPDMEVLSSSGMTPVARIGTSDIYVAVSKKRPDLLYDLNQSQSIIESSDPYFSSRLHEKYFSNLAVRKDLSSRERGWLEEHDVINIGYIENFPPFSSTGETGQPQGIIIDTVNKIFARYKLSAAVTYTAYGDFNEMVTDLKTNKLDLIVPVFDSYWYSEKEGIIQSAQFANVPLSLIYSKTQHIDEETIFAKAYNNHFHAFPIDSYYADNPKIHCLSDTNCLEKVDTGLADVTLLNSYQATSLLRDYPDLHAKDSDHTAGFCVASSADALPLLTIINRGLTSTTSSEVPNWILNQPDNAQDLSWSAIIRTHLVAFVAAVIAFMTVISLLLLLTQRHLRFKKSLQRLTPHLNENFDFSGSSFNEFVKNGMQLQLKTGKDKAQIFKKLLSNREYISLLKDFLGSYEVRHDALTALPSASYFMELTNQEKKKNEETSVIIAFNLNDFAQFNATYGPGEGDKLLKSFARLLLNTFGDRCCARFGEDLFYARSSRSQVEAKIDSLFTRMVRANHGRTLSVRAGIYVEDKPQVNTLTACDLAREALKSNHNTSESSYIFFDHSRFEEVISREYILRNYETALKNNLIKVFYLPKIRSADGSLIGFEAKVRWDDPKRGTILPAEFIPVLEKHSVTNKLDRFVAEQVVSDIARARDSGLCMLPVSFNLSQADFKGCSTCEALKEICDRYKIPTKLIKLEITEPLLINSPLHTKLELQSLRNAGFEILMDHFGNGYATLSLLRDYEFDEIKLDCGFMKNFGKKSKAILKPIVSMAKDLNIRTLADGVETAEQLEFLGAIGCEMMQGPLFGEAEPYEIIIKRFFNKNGTNLNKKLL